MNKTKTNNIFFDQIIYKNDIGEISLIEINNRYKDGFNYEVYCLEGNLFEDIDRFETLEKAEKFIFKKLKHKENKITKTIIGQTKRIIEI